MTKVLLCSTSAAPGADAMIMITVITIPMMTGGVTIAPAAVNERKVVTGDRKATRTSGQTDISTRAATMRMPGIVNAALAAAAGTTASGRKDRDMTDCSSAPFVYGAYS